MIKLVVSLYDKLRELTESNNKKLQVTRAVRAVAVQKLQKAVTVEQQNFLKATIVKTSVKVLQYQSRQILANIALGIYVTLLELSNSASVSDSIRKNLTKFLDQENIAASDSSLKIFGKNPTDTANLAELVTKVLEKKPDDNLTVNELLKVLTSRTVTDLAGITDQKSINVLKTLADGLKVTDDLDGIASLDDDQTIIFIKNITDIVGIQDSATVGPQFYRDFPQQLNILETYLMLLAKKLEENINIADSVAKSVSKTNTEQLGIQDTYSPIIGKNNLEQISLTESFSRNISKSILEETIITDVLGGSTSIGDQQSVSLLKGFLDSATISDIFNRIVAYNREPAEQLNILDNRTINFAKPIADSSSVQDTKILNIQSSKTDIYNVADIYSHTVIKPILDNSVLLDISTKSIVKSLSETNVISDNSKYSLLRNFLDAYKVSDNFTLGFSKSAAETLNFSDSYNHTFGKNPTDSTKTVDTINYSFTKSVTEVNTIIDTSVYNLNRSIYDGIVATDDIDGVASLDDNQTISFIKSTTEVLTFFDYINISNGFIRNFIDSSIYSDFYSYNIVKSAADTATLSDSSYKISLTKNITEQPKVLDSNYLNFAKSLSDSYNLSDSLSNTTVKNLTEQYKVADSYLLNFIKPYTDQSTVSETYRLISTKPVVDILNVLENKLVSTTKPFSEGTILSDNSLKVFNKNILDSVRSTDDIDGITTVNDDQTIVFSKPISEIVGILDIPTISTTFTRAFSESTRITDSALIVSQTYADGTYFGGDYVGISRTT